MGSSLMQGSLCNVWIITDDASPPKDSSESQWKLTLHPQSPSRMSIAFSNHQLLD
jgi:hypothetical protein